MHAVKIDKTVYEKKEDSDGKRILVMRFWPRGIRKSSVDLWMKDVGTSPDLIKDWKSGKVTRAVYEVRYSKMMQGELQQKLISELAGYASEGPITLLCSCKDPNKCHRSLLKEMIETLS